MTLKSNFKFYLTDKFNSGATTVTIGNDVETDSSVELSTATSILIRHPDKADVIERITATATGGTLTTTARGLSNANPGVAAAGNEVDWRPGAVCYVTLFPEDILEKDATDTVSGDITFSGEVNHSGGSYTEFATTAARDSALGADGVATEPRKGVYVAATGLHYNYNLSTSQWESIDTGTVTPNGTDAIAGKWEGSTVAEQGSQSATGGTGAGLVLQPKNLVKTSSGAGDENKIVTLNSLGKFPSGFTNINNLNAIGASGATETIVWDNGDVQSITIDEDCTLTFTDPTSGSKRLKLVITNTGGFTPTFPSGFYRDGLVDPVWTNPYVDKYIINMTFDGTDYYGNIEYDNEGISLVGSATSETVTIDISGIDVKPGDVVFAVYTHIHTDVTTMSVTGYTEISQLQADDTVDTNFAAYYKVQTLTVDTSVVLTKSPVGIEVTGVAYVLRGVDNSTPMDVTATTATGTNGNVPDPASITPVTKGAIVMACGGFGDSENATISFPTGYTDGISDAVDSTHSSNTAACMKRRSGSGAEDPGTITGGTGSASYGRCAITLAIRPAT